MATAGVLVSPVSWTHHYVWIAIGVLVAAAVGRPYAATPTLLPAAQTERAPVPTP